MATMWRFYLRMLRERTLPTQMATGGVIGFTADSIAQQVVEGTNGHNWARTGRQTFYSSCIFAPVANRAFAVLNLLKLKNVWPTALMRTGIDMVTFMPSFTVLYVGGMGLMEGRPLPEIKQRWLNSAPTVIPNQWMVFGPAQVVNMALLPLYARPPFMACVGLGWTVYLATMNSKPSTLPGKLAQVQEAQMVAAQTEI